MKFKSAALLATLLLAGCAAEHNHRYSDSRDYRSSCTAPAVGVCAGCEISCSRRDEAYCEPGHSMPAQGTNPGYCSEEARCVCRD
ncbi:MAG: hypothetical protein ACREI7_03500 [Myxococcota bacterium]